MTHYKLINFTQKEALTWKEKQEYEAEIKKLKEQKAQQEKEMEEKKNAEDLAKGKGKLEKIDEEEELPELVSGDNDENKTVNDNDGINVEIEKESLNNNE